MTKPWPKALFLGVLSSVFFSVTYVVNSAMAQSGGYWMWSASLRYLLLLPMLLVLTVKQGWKPVFTELKRAPFQWILWSTVGFGLFYAPMAFSAAYGPSWMVAGVFQFTMLAGALETPLFRNPDGSRQKIPTKLFPAFAVIIGKEVFGGTGMNIWNPALLARAFLFFSYPSKMSGDYVWVAGLSDGGAVNGFSGATPMVHAQGGLESLQQAGTSLFDLIIGTVPGAVGETSVIAILIGAVILIWTGVASWKIMLSSVIGALAIGFLCNALATDATPYLQLPAYYHLVLGGFAFGTVFMATDPVTSAQTETGKWIYGFLIGALTVIVRLFNPGYMEGMMLAILLMNTFAPLIDHYVVSASLKRRAKKVKIA